MTDSRRRFQFTLRIDEDTNLALRRLATQDGRSCNSQIAYLIRQAAVVAGVWIPSRPHLTTVTTSNRRQNGVK